jgi:integrase
VLASGAVQLFPELSTNEHGRFAGLVSKWWRKYLLRFGITGNAYRFRHTFTDALRRAGHLNEEIGPLLGHQDGSTTERYGNLAQVTVDRRSQIVAAANFPIELTPRRV